ncbi:MAG: DUF1858 domain-containing protein [Nitrospinae bacterium]|nr:DUF1858 domain-containing protein [Nitrospinota bacterium]
MEITKDSSINEILKEFPESAKVFDKYNMGCMGCMGASAESVENGALMHGLDANMIVEELNRIIGRKQQS